MRRHSRPPLALRRPRGPGWQESRRMHPHFAECAKKAPSLAISARNACFSRSKWQDPRLMRPFPGAIGRFGMHGARILPSRPPPFRVEGPEIIHGAKMLPTLPDLSRHLAAGRGPANWPCVLRSGPCPLAACTSLCPSRRPAATCARGPPPIAAIRTSAPHPIAAVTHAAAFIAAALHVAPAVPTMPPALSIAVGGGPPIGHPAALALPMPSHPPASIAPPAGPPASRRPAATRARAPPRFPQFP